MKTYLACRLLIKNLTISLLLIMILSGCTVTHKFEIELISPLPLPEIQEAPRSIEPRSSLPFPSELSSLPDMPLPTSLTAEGIPDGYPAGRFPLTGCFHLFERDEYTVGIRIEEGAAWELTCWQGVCALCKVKS